MKKAKILLVSHIYQTESGPVYGPFNTIEDYLITKKKKFLTVKYPLSSKIPLVLKSIIETFSTVKTALNFKPDIYIGIDPLNAFAGVILKKNGIVKKTIFYCVDYTPTRFPNQIINSIYLWIDKFVSVNSDEVWNVSTRIIDVRKIMGISDEKLKFLPNSPNFASCPKLPLDKVDRNRIVMVAGLTHGHVLDMVLNSFKNIHKDWPKTTLSIIGTGPYQENIINKAKKMKLSKHVNFLGQLSNKDLLTEVSRSGLALAIYTFSKDYSWIYYGDSKKAREYVACGTPVIITNVVATAEDISKFNAGIVIKPIGKNLTEAMRKIIGNKKYWLESRKNALRLGRAYNINSLLDVIFTSL